MMHYQEESRMASEQLVTEIRIDDSLKFRYLKFDLLLMNLTYGMSLIRKNFIDSLKNPRRSGRTFNNPKELIDFHR